MTSSGIEPATFRLAARILYGLPANQTEVVRGCSRSQANVERVVICKWAVTTPFQILTLSLMSIFAFSLMLYVLLR
jgi:hypothetical protein